jgi:hypothetical protein
MASDSASASNFRVFGTIAIIAAFAGGILVGRVILSGGSNAGSGQTARVNAPKAVIPPGLQAIGFLNMVDGKPVVHASPHADIHLSGWAVCVDANSQLTAVDILIDMQVKGQASLGLPRTDVAEAYGRPEFKMSGWKSTVSLGEIEPGTHELTGRAVCAHGETGTLPPFQLSVE